MQAVVQGRDALAPDRPEGLRAQRGQKVIVERVPALPDRGRLAAHLDVLAHVAFRHLGDRVAGLHGSRAVCGKRLPAGLDVGDDPRRRRARLVRRDQPVPSDGEPPGPAALARLHEVDLRPRGIDADAEARELRVPVERLALAHRERLDGSPRDPPCVQCCHGPLPFPVVMDACRYAPPASSVRMSAPMLSATRAVEALTDSRARWA